MGSDHFFPWSRDSRPKAAYVSPAELMFAYQEKRKSGSIHRREEVGEYDNKITVSRDQPRRDSPTPSETGYQSFRLNAPSQVQSYAEVESSGSSDVNVAGKRRKADEQSSDEEFDPLNTKKRQRGQKSRNKRRTRKSKVEERDWPSSRRDITTRRRTRDVEIESTHEWDLADDERLDDDLERAELESELPGFPSGFTCPAPPTIDEFEAWLNNRSDGNLIVRDGEEYEFVVNKVKLQKLQSEIIQSAAGKRKKIGDGYMYTLQLDDRTSIIKSVLYFACWDNLEMDSMYRDNWEEESDFDYWDTQGAVECGFAIDVSKCSKKT
jgi:hypothetical protein